MSARHARPDVRRPGDALVRVGAAVFLAGVLAVVVAVVPSVLSGDAGQPVLVVAAGSLLPAGLGLALLGLLRAARSRRLPARQSG